MRLINGIDRHYCCHCFRRMARYRPGGTVRFGAVFHRLPSMGSHRQRLSRTPEPGLQAAALHKTVRRRRLPILCERAKPLEATERASSGRRDDSRRIHRNAGCSAEPATSYEGSRRGVGVMVKDSSRYAATGATGVLKATRATAVSRTHSSAACYACHNAFRKDHDFTFLKYKE